MEWAFWTHRAKSWIRMTSASLECMFIQGYPPSPAGALGRQRSWSPDQLWTPPDWICYRLSLKGPLASAVSFCAPFPLLQGLGLLQLCRSVLVLTSCPSSAWCDFHWPTLQMVWAWLNAKKSRLLWCLPRGLLVEDTGLPVGPCWSCMHGFCLGCAHPVFLSVSPHSDPQEPCWFQFILLLLESQLLICWSEPLSQRKAANQSRSLPCLPRGNLWRSNECLGRRGCSLSSQWQS